MSTRAWTVDGVLGRPAFADNAEVGVVSRVIGAWSEDEGVTEQPLVNVWRHDGYADRCVRVRWSETNRNVRYVGVGGDRPYGFSERKVA